MQVNPKLIKNQFEKSIDKYLENADVQKIMAKKLVENLVDIRRDFTNVLELGCGAGILTEQLFQNISYKSYFANDLVAKSEKYVKKFIPDVRFYCGNAQRIKPSRKMDLIVSNAMFQWFDNPEKVCNYYKTLLEKDGILAFTSFGEGNYKEIKDLTGLSLRYRTFDEMNKILSENYEVLYSEQFSYVMRFENPLQLLTHMKNTGVNSLSSRHWTFKEVKSFCDKYAEKYPLITLSYAPFVFICRH